MLWCCLISVIGAIAISLVGTGCEDDISDSSGGGSSGNCASNARRIQADMSSSQVVNIMGSPDTDHAVMGERQMTWRCGSDTVMVDFQPDNRVYMVLLNDSILVLRNSYY